MSGPNVITMTQSTSAQVVITQGGIPGAPGPAGGAGLIASRPAANIVPGGYLYLATDVNGGTLYRSDTATWTQAAAGINAAAALIAALNLGTAATHAATDFDSAGAASSAQSAAISAAATDATGKANTAQTNATAAAATDATAKVSGEATARTTAIGVETSRATTAEGGISALLGQLAFNVKDPQWAGGAKGDWNGTTGTDDTAAFLAAINAANGAPVYVPAGRYRVALNLTDQPVRLYGPGVLMHREAASVIQVSRSLGTARPLTSVATYQLGVNSPTLPFTDRSATKIVFTSSCADLHNGSVLFLVSQDHYAADYSPGLGDLTYHAGYALVHGLGLSLSAVANGGPLEGDVVTGGTSGATGLVTGVALQQDGTTTVIFSHVSADFTSGETLTVAGQSRGTVSGVLFVLSAGQLLDAYTTSPVAYVIGNPICDLDVQIDAEGDVDAIVGVDNRVAAILLQHVVDARVKAKITNAWTRGVEFDCCYAPVADVEIDKLPNAGTDNGYGYGIVVYGATEMGRFKIIGRNLRHAFTTNVTWNTAFGFVNLREVGVPKYNTIHDSIAYDTISAGFDTHAGAFYTTFDNCKVYRNFSGGRYLTASGGFQNRAFGTVYNDCVSEGSIIGFYDITGTAAAPPFPQTIQYNNCVARGYQYMGYHIGNADLSANSFYEYNNCEAIGDGTSQSPYYQAGFSGGGNNVRYNNCTSRKFSGTPFRWWNSAGGDQTLINCFADYTECYQFASGVRYDTAPTTATILGHKVRLSATPSNLASAVRVAVAGVVLTSDGVTWLDGNGTNPPFSVNTGAGSVTTTFVGLQAEINRATASEALLAAIASPTFTGTPLVPTASPGTNTTQAASTAFVAAALAGVSSIANYANLAAFPGSGAVGVLYIADDTNYLYRWTGSAYVQVGVLAASAATPQPVGTAAVGVSTTPSRDDHVHSMPAAVGPGSALNGGVTTAARLVGAHSGGAPTTGAFAIGDITVDGGSFHICTAAGTPGTWSTINAVSGATPNPVGTAAAGSNGAVSHSDHVHAQQSAVQVASPLTGVTANARFVGATGTGAAPTTGTFVAGDFAVDIVTPKIWICKVGGTPGTWA